MQIVLSIIIGVAFELCLAMPIKYYASRYDHIDVEAILNNRRLVKYYSLCLLNQGPCPPEGVEFKRILPEALQTNCARCSEKQKTVTRRVIRRLKKEYPKIWAQLSELWDPEDIFVRKFESQFNTKTSILQTTPTITSTSGPPQLFNRFGDDENVSQNISRTPEAAKPVVSISSTTPLTTTTIVPKKSVTSPSSPRNTVTETKPYPSKSSTTSPRTETQRLPNLSTSTPINKQKASSTSTSTESSSSSSSTTSGQTYTNKSLIVTISTTNVPNIRQSIGANIEATVKAFRKMERRLARLARKKLQMLNRFLIGSKIFVDI